MRFVKNLIPIVFLLASLIFCLSQPTIAQKSNRSRTVSATPILWRDPGDIATRDLLHGPGSAEMAPAAPFTFIKEDKSGESPKFEVRDAKSVEWRVKLGPKRSVRQLRRAWSGRSATSLKRGAPVV